MLCHSATLSDFPSVHTEYTSQSSLLLRLNWWMSGVTQTIWAQSPPLAHFFLGPKSPRPIWNLHRGPGPEQHMFKLITCGNPIRFPSPILSLSLSLTRLENTVCLLHGIMYSCIQITKDQLERRRRCCERSGWEGNREWARMTPCMSHDTSITYWHQRAYVSHVTSID